jgi:hypothetical protein
METPLACGASFSDSFLTRSPMEFSPGPLSLLRLDQSILIPIVSPQKEKLETKLILVNFYFQVNIFF